MSWGRGDTCYPSEPWRVLSKEGQALICVLGVPLAEWIVGRREARRGMPTTVQAREDGGWVRGWGRGAVDVVRSGLILESL